MELRVAAFASPAQGVSVSHVRPNSWYVSYSVNCRYRPISFPPLAKASALQSGKRRMADFRRSQRSSGKRHSMSRIRARFHPGTILGLLITAGLTNLPVPSWADVIFSNITGPCCGGQAIDGSDFAPNSAAEQFTPAATYRVTDASVVVVWTGLGSPLFNVAIYSDATGIPDFPVGETVTNLTAPPPLGGIVTASFGTTFLLPAGDAFWIVLTPADNATRIGWQTGGSISAPAAFTDATDGIGGWTAPGPNHFQFAINGAAIPETSTWAMMLVGFAGFGYAAYRRERRSQSPCAPISFAMRCSANA